MNCSIWITPIPVMLDLFSALGLYRIFIADGDLESAAYFGHCSYVPAGVITLLQTGNSYQMERRNS